MTHRRELDLGCDPIYIGINQFMANPTKLQVSRVQVKQALTALAQVRV
jgi:hypothetical protein